jgi:hypothetical protein
MAFATDHPERMRANNPAAVLDEGIAMTSAALANRNGHKGVEFTGRQ